MRPAADIRDGSERNMTALKIVHTNSMNAMKVSPMTIGKSPPSDEMPPSAIAVAGANPHAQYAAVFRGWGIAALIVFLMHGQITGSRTISR